MVLAALNKIRPERCIGGTRNDLTPTYARPNRFRQFLEAEDHEPPQADAIHFSPNIEGAETYLYRPDYTLIRSARMPEDQNSRVWLAPTEHGVGVKLMGLVTVLPDYVIDMVEERVRAA